MTTLMRWDPLRNIESMRDELGRVFGSRLFGNAPADLWSPAVDVIEADDEVLLKAELSGMTPDQISIECDDHMLTISGERTFDDSTTASGHSRIERGYGRFERTFGMPKNVKIDQIAATFHDGVLEIHVPKAAEPATTRIPIAT
jgi:HSP20 family protein